jgi:predicted Fe-S protein YdhL (DUF1289 family)
MASPASPCIGLCRLDEDDLCEGCGRTLGEIAEWSAASPERQQAIVDAAIRRKSCDLGQPARHSRESGIPLPFSG